MKVFNLGSTTLGSTTKEVNLMSVKKATMVNIIGRIQDYDRILNDIIITKKVEAVSAIGQIEKNNFLLDVSNENVERLVDINFVSFYEDSAESANVLEKGKALASMLGLELESGLQCEDLNMSLGEIKDEFDLMYDNALSPKTMLDALKHELKYLEDFHVKSFREMLNFDTSLSDLREMNYFEFKLGILSRDNRNNLKKNYDSILAIIQHTGTSSDGEVFMIIYPTNQQEEISRILRTHSFKEIVIPKQYKGNPKEILSQIEDKKEKLSGELLSQKEALEKLKLKYEERLKFLFGQLHNLIMLEEVKKTTAVSDKYFYFSGILSNSNVSEIREVLQKYDDVFMLFYNDRDFNENRNRIWEIIKGSGKAGPGDAATEKINNKDYVNAFGIALYHLDKEINSIRKQHEDSLRKKKLEGQNRVYELEKELKDQYWHEADLILEDIGSIKRIEAQSNQEIPKNKAIEQVEQDYIKIKSDLLDTLWEEILESKE
ncbi:hypothetical protein [Gudongella sp. DL1XJH-153]|uniref:hypothetical protein n=1 Tax=Gudongella sp. DL1XJH-153 TaxID=3409804 RepID=UPI003BB7641C